ncbi:hypothetical protein AB0M22_41950 [Nocardia sp. NPDC051756]|uniref:hypothetical protein n=1 Tax=Nocardia sp. NPDC051756 TaxID=3154751 RepID=UPI00341DEA8B
MSDKNADQHRTRRRAVRSVGPPVEETAGSAVTSVPVAETGAAQAAATAVPVSTAKTPDAENASAVPASGSATTEAKDAAPVDAVVVEDSADGKVVDLAKGVPADAADTGTERTRSGVWRIVGVAAASVLVLALLIGAGFAGMKVRSIDARDDRRGEYEQTARQAILNLTTIRADSAKADIDRILSVASGQFKTEFDGRVDPFMNIVQQAKVVSNGEIVDAALENDSDDSATVLVAAKQSLTNAGQQGEQTRFYRFRVTVSRGDSGMTVSKVEFVG